MLSRIIANFFLVHFGKKRMTKDVFPANVVSDRNVWLSSHQQWLKIASKWSKKWRSTRNELNIVQSVSMSWMADENKSNAIAGMAISIVPGENNKQCYRMCVSFLFLHRWFLHLSFSSFWMRPNSDYPLDIAVTFFVLAKSLMTLGSWPNRFTLRRPYKGIRRVDGIAKGDCNVNCIWQNGRSPFLLLFQNVRTVQDTQQCHELRSEPGAVSLLIVSALDVYHHRFAFFTHFDAQSISNAIVKFQSIQKKNVCSLNFNHCSTQYQAINSTKMSLSALYVPIEWLWSICEILEIGRLKWKRVRSTRPSSWNWTSVLEILNETVKISRETRCFLSVSFFFCRLDMVWRDALWHQL